MFFPDTFRLKDRLYFLIYPFKRVKIVFKIVKPFLKHPLLTLKNSKFLPKKYRFPGGFFLGIKDEKEFLNYMENLKKKYKNGEIEKPELIILEPYCEKPMRCACFKDRNSKYFKPQSERRFNEMCVAKNEYKVCVNKISGKCEIGKIYTLPGKNEYLKPKLKIMLDENQMTDIWEEFMDFQAKNGYIRPFIMTVCPLAHWLAEISLYRLKTPIGIVLFLNSENICKTMKEYVAADDGRKGSYIPTSLPEDLKNFKLKIFKRIN